MPSKRVGDVQHPPVIWRGITVTQWFGTGRTAALRGGDFKYNEPRIDLAVKYLKGTPVVYDATISMAAVTCTVYGFDKPKDALDEAAERIQRLANALKEANG